MTSVLVTGAGGFIGSQLVRQLVERGDDVVCLAHHRRYQERLAERDVRVAVGDVRSFDSLRSAVEGVEVVYHLAGRIRALSAESFRAANTRGTENIATACAAAKSPPVLVIVSSLAAGGPSQPGQPRTETDRPTPVSHYGRSKRDGELAAARSAGEVPISIVRPPFVFGGGDQTSLPIFRAIKRFGLHVIPRGGDLELTLIHIDDVVAGLVEVAVGGERLDAAEIRAGGGSFQTGLYYVGDPHVVTYSEMGRLIGQAFDRNVRIIRIPQPVLWAAAGFNELTARIVRRARVLNFDKLREATAPGWTCSSEKIRQQLGITPPTRLADRIRRTAEWYCREGWV